MMVKVMVALLGAGSDITLLGTLGGAAPGDRDKYQIFSYKNIRTRIMLLCGMYTRQSCQNNNVTSNSHHGAIHSSYWG